MNKADFAPEQKQYKNLTPFKMQVLQNFPFIEEDFDSLTNYGLLSKISEYLTNVIKNETVVTENTQKLYNAYISLQTYVNNYFNNLDVQENIDVKIDDLVKNGIFNNAFNTFVSPILENQNEKIQQQNNIIIEQNNKINKSIGHSPKAVKSIEEMTDTTKNYVNTSDGKWYYYNDETSVWSVGGVYQSTGISTNSISLDKINFNVYEFNDFVVVNKKLAGYNTTTFLPRYEESETDEYYTAEIDIVENMQNIYFPVSDLNGQIIVVYTENERANNQTYDNILNNPAYYIKYDELTGLCEVLMDSLYVVGYRKIAIQMSNTNNIIQIKNVDGSNIDIPIKKFINGDNLKDKSISRDKIDFDVTDITDKINYIRSDRLTSRYSRGYNTETAKPVFTDSENAKTIEIPITSTGKIKISKTLFIDDQCQLYLIRKNDTIFTNITNQVLLSYTDLPRNVYHAGNILLTIYNDYIEFNCDYIYSLEVVKSIIVTFNSSQISNSYINFINSFKPEWLSNTTENFDNVEVILPSKMRVIKGVEANIYYQNILRYYNTDLLQRVETNAMLSPYKKYLRMNADKESVYSTNMDINFYLKDTKYPNKKGSIYIEAVPQNAGNGLTKKILFIGDSMTKAGKYTQELLNLFSNDVMNVEFLGTQGTGSNQHEGRNGWRAYNYCYCQNGSDDPAVSLTGTNPFYNPTSEQFDFSYYMNNQNYSNVDYVFLNIGTNDWTRGDYNTEEEILQFYNLMINSIKEYDSNIKIAIWLPTTKGLFATDDKKQIDLALRSQVFAIKYFDNKENQNIFLVPVYFNVDPEHDYPYQTKNVSARNNLFTEKVCTDRTHPSTVGYNKIADVIYTYIKYFASLT